MTVRERIMMIRLMRKLERYPAYAKALGIEATSAMNHQNIKNDQKGLANR